MLCARRAASTSPSVSPSTAATPASAAAAARLRLVAPPGVPCRQSGTPYTKAQLACIAMLASVLYT